MNLPIRIPKILVRKEKQQRSLVYTTRQNPKLQGKRKTELKDEKRHHGCHKHSVRVRF